jgi:hypothetical protein
MTLIWDILNRCTQHELNKLFYKNNLFWFVDNTVVMNKIIQILSTLDVPFIDPNKPPQEVKDMMDELYQMIYDGYIMISSIWIELIEQRICIVVYLC